MTEHLAIRAPNWVGDLAMATPILRAALASERWGRVDIILRKHLVGVWPRALVPRLDVGAEKVPEQRAGLERLGLGGTNTEPAQFPPLRRAVAGARWGLGIVRQ